VAMSVRALTPTVLEISSEKEEGVPATPVARDVLRTPGVLQYATTDDVKTHCVSAGVSQGSVLGPLLWNAMYDGVLRLALPLDSHIVGFADDVAIVVVAKELRTTEETCNTFIARVQRWLTSTGLQLAAH